MNILLSGFSCLVTGKGGFALNGANCEVKLLESRRPLMIKSNLP